MSDEERRTWLHDLDDVATENNWHWWVAWILTLTLVLTPGGICVAVFVGPILFGWAHDVEKEKKRREEERERAREKKERRRKADEDMLHGRSDDRE